MINRGEKARQYKSTQVPAWPRAEGGDFDDVISSTLYVRGYINSTSNLLSNSACINYGIDCSRRLHCKSLAP